MSDDNEDGDNGDDDNNNDNIILYNTNCSQLPKMAAIIKFDNIYIYLTSTTIESKA